MSKKLLALVLVMLFSFTGLVSAQGRGVGPPDRSPGPPVSPGAGITIPMIKNGALQAKENGQVNNGEDEAEGTEMNEKGGQAVDNGENRRPVPGRAHPVHDRPLGPPAFVQEMLEQKFAVMDYSKLKIRNRPFESDLPPVIKEGRVLVPIRAVAVGLNANVEWDPEEGKITITKGDTVIELYLGELIYYVNGEAQEMDVGAQIISSRTFVPLRFIAVALGERVKYDPETGEIEVGNAKGDDDDNGNDNGDDAADEKGDGSEEDDEGDDHTR